MIAKSYENELLTGARKLFYESVNDENKLNLAIEEFKSIMKNYPDLKGLAITYIGSLEMIKGKHAFWPHTKLKHVDNGIEIMNKGLNYDPDNIESLFVYGSTCYYLPFFLGKGSLAKSKLKRIVELIDESDIAKYDNNILLNVIEFLVKEVDLKGDEKTKLNKLANQIKYNASKSK